MESLQLDCLKELTDRINAKNGASATNLIKLEKMLLQNKKSTILTFGTNQDIPIALVLENDCLTSYLEDSYSPNSQMQQILDEFKRNGIRISKHHLSNGCKAIATSEKINDMVSILKQYI